MHPKVNRRAPSYTKSEQAGITALAALCRTSSHHREFAEPALYGGLDFLKHHRNTNGSSLPSWRALGVRMLGGTIYSAARKKGSPALDGDPPDFASDFGDVPGYAYAAALMPRLKLLSINLYETTTPAAWDPYWARENRVQQFNGTTPGLAVFTNTTDEVLWGSGPEDIAPAWNVISDARSSLEVLGLNFKEILVHSVDVNIGRIGDLSGLQRLSRPRRAPRFGRRRHRR
ncbi:hypothetical protein PspLS_00273 [Pyricularia sp. CBS 133598]|nr:hypothetical protein PspLS_00273 [Pyricularia sp. CBS 133598]